MVKNSAFRFPYDSAFRIQPNSPVRLNWIENFLFYSHEWKLTIFLFHIIVGMGQEVSWWQGKNKKWFKPIAYCVISNMRN